MKALTTDDQALSHLQVCIESSRVYAVIVAMQLRSLCISTIGRIVCNRQESMACAPTFFVDVLHQSSILYHGKVTLARHSADESHRVTVLEGT